MIDNIVLKSLIKGMGKGSYPFETAIMCIITDGLLLSIRYIEDKCSN